MKIMIAAVASSLVATFFTSISAMAATCGHDVHGAPTIEVTELGENNSVLHYFSPATLVMDDTSHPAHRAFGECRGQGITIDGVSLTVNEVKANYFETNVIPHTQKVTTLGAVQPGTQVNIEIDLLARYVERSLRLRDLID